MRYRTSGGRNHYIRATRDHTVANDLSRKSAEPRNMASNRSPMKLIPWEDIWTSLRVARIRGNGEMIEVFYDTLFKEAVFDDRGAWSLDFRKES